MQKKKNFLFNSIWLVHSVCTYRFQCKRISFLQKKKYYPKFNDYNEQNVLPNRIYISYLYSYNNNYYQVVESFEKFHFFLFCLFFFCHGYWTKGKLHFCSRSGITIIIIIIIAVAVRVYFFLFFFFLFFGHSSVHDDSFFL